MEGPVEGSPMYWKAYKQAEREARSWQPMKTFSQQDLKDNP